MKKYLCFILTLLMILLVSCNHEQPSKSKQEESIFSNDINGAESFNPIDEYDQRGGSGESCSPVETSTTEESGSFEHSEGTIEESGIASSTYKKDKTGNSGSYLGYGQYATKSDSMKAVWVSYLTLNFKGMGADDIKAKVDTIMDNAVSFGLNTVVLQVRPFADAYYKSGYFPTSHQITGEQGAPLPLDILEYAVSKAHEKGLALHAWVNPYRVQKQTSEALVPQNLANSVKEKEAANPHMYLNVGGNKYLNPASDDAINLIINGVKEIAEKYKVDGIQFDDYFYPDDIGDADSEDYNYYKNQCGGTMSIEDWRRDNVSRLITGCYSAVKSACKNVQFGVSPQDNVDTNYSSKYADIVKWATNSRYIDYLAPQIYFGFENESRPFEKSLTYYSGLNLARGVKLYCGIASYKTGRQDTYAGSGKEEWLNASDILARQVKRVKDNSKYSGFILYDYDALFTKKVSYDYVEEVRTKEIENLENIIKV